MDATDDHPESIDPAARAAATELLAGNPALPLDHRWRRAGLPLVRGDRRGRPDGWAGRARRFRSALARVGGDPGHPRLARADPDVQQALLLSVGPGRTRWEVEARLLAGQSDGEIAAKVGVDAGVVAAYEALFYEVRAGLGSPDWVALVAIGPELHEGFGPEDLDVLWKLFAYHGGEHVLDALIAATGGSTGAAAGPPDPRVAGLVDLAIAVRTAPALPDPLDWVRLDGLAGEIRRREAASCVAAVTGPVVVAPPEVRPGSAAGLARDAGGPAGDEDGQAPGPTAGPNPSLREAG